MELLVRNSPSLEGDITPPGSKSHSIRALMVALMAKGASTLSNLLDSDDIQAATSVCQALGIQTQQKNNQLTIQGQGLPLKSNATELFTRNSGITTRFILPMLGLRSDTTQPIRLDCGEQMRARPIESLVASLRELGMTISYEGKNAALPLKIAGPLKGGKSSVDGTTSQYISALLLSLPCAPQDSEITVSNLHERPYMEMTLHWLREQGVQFTHHHHAGVDRFEIPGRQHYTAFQLAIPGDFSSASYPIAAAAILNGNVTVRGLNLSDPQGDKRLIAILKEMGANVVASNDGIQIHGGAALRGIEIDANDVPDLLPTLAVVGTRASGKTVIRNVRQARIKETDRIRSMCEGLQKMGARIEAHEDGLTVHQSTLHGASVNGYGDHRTVMALAIAGLTAVGETCISDAEAVSKTYPNFVTEMQRLGAAFKVQS
ncbi:MAG: 3-phosphoshikimate 1-carboxyvinyltransferase [Deltaproteobacteria bacterium CG11_big_fil_rev_8_21_14_0_20_47_16]|nr:MAG: 3-phosphoshikimate 1-carboxyvinyltransferase [Deltaproteobacteria bacterium CG11_big_fil_rev_8_21_14_0_20_47_16]